MAMDNDETLQILHPRCGAGTICSCYQTIATAGQTNMDILIAYSLAWHKPQIFIAMSNDQHLLHSGQNSVVCLPQPSQTVQHRFGIMLFARHIGACRLNVDEAALATPYKPAFSCRRSWHSQDHTGLVLDAANSSIPFYCGSWSSSTTPNAH
jgi:hypothetical protein